MPALVSASSWRSRSCFAVDMSAYPRSTSQTYRRLALYGILAQSFSISIWDSSRHSARAASREPRARRLYKDARDLHRPTSKVLGRRLRRLAASSSPVLTPVYTTMLLIRHQTLRARDVGIFPN